MTQVRYSQRNLAHFQALMDLNQSFHLRLKSVEKEKKQKKKLQLCSPTQLHPITFFAT
jgi:hypothetical protein